MAHKTRKVQIRRMVNIDEEIADEIAWLNDQGIFTEASCRGFNGEPANALIQAHCIEKARELGYDPKPHGFKIWLGFTFEFFGYSLTWQCGWMPELYKIELQGGAFGGMFIEFPSGPSLMPENTTLGAHIRQHRLEHSWSQETLAEKTDISRNYLSQLERGQADNPSWRIVQKILRHLT